MACHETVHCPCCNTAFECRVGTILRCQCQEVSLTDDERFFISQQFNGCLCASCLQTMKQQYKQEQFRQRLQQIFNLSAKR
ncbi:cysteine-rich CWC family protein [Chitinophaga agrisoli]|uniref:Cysteine-rich CWC family protein n=1 Tax=Chitinophaga agrisoli TaxID=2607653 RepID=A0A5B2VM22_9BACT|nr:cysteine-rich CWC family protein [Chitinophaga agrisoli]KAA2240081.1 cysteine-rich CWC family protein [Chitinophaga agrisoli]